MTKGKKRGTGRTASTSSHNSPNLNPDLALPSNSPTLDSQTLPKSTMKDETVMDVDDQPQGDMAASVEDADVDSHAAQSTVAAEAESLAAPLESQSITDAAQETTFASEPSLPHNDTSYDAQQTTECIDENDESAPVDLAAADSKHPIASTSAALAEDPPQAESTITSQSESAEPESYLDNEPSTFYSGKPKRNTTAKKASAQPVTPSAPKTKGANATAMGKKGTGSAKSTPRFEDSKDLFKDEIFVEKRGARAARNGAAKKLIEVDEDEGFLIDEEEEGDDGAEGVTRCICGEDTVEKEQELMIQCDTCKCWQHGPCVGLMEEEACPDRYFCELCKPTWHGPNGQIRKTHRKASAANRSPAITTASLGPAPPTLSSGRASQKPRESVDAALVSAFLANDATPQQPTDSAPGSARKSSRSLSPSHSNKLEPVPKKRSTMNSRDAAYDDAIALSILEQGPGAVRSKLDRHGVSASANGDDEVDEAQEEESGRSKKSSRGSQGNAAMPPMSDLEPGADPGDEEAVGERELDPAADGTSDENGNHLDGSPNSMLPRAKHPNQYTYRPKPTPAPPAARGRGSPVKRGSGREAGPSNANGGANGVNASGVTMASSEHQSRTHRPQRDWVPGNDPSGWGMPEHLKHLSHLLPTPSPQPIHVPCKRSREDYAGHSSSNAEASIPTIPEAPTRVRFPNKRITMPEMKKRARNVLEYLTRVQIEMSERERRAAVTRVSASASVPEPVEHSESMTMMDDLTKEIILFQQKFFDA